jgi:hypothetical protein
VLHALLRRSSLSAAVPCASSPKPGKEKNGGDILKIWVIRKIFCVVGLAYASPRKLSQHTTTHNPSFRQRQLEERQNCRCAWWECRGTQLEAKSVIIFSKHVSLKSTKVVDAKMLMNRFSSYFRQGELGNIGRSVGSVPICVEGNCSKFRSCFLFRRFLILEYALYLGAPLPCCTSWCLLDNGKFISAVKGVFCFGSNGRIKLGTHCRTESDAH